MSMTGEAGPDYQETTIKYVCGVVIGRQTCSGCAMWPDKSVMLKPITFTNSKEGWQVWVEKLNLLHTSPGQILIGIDASSGYGENLYHELEQRGYVLRLVHPRNSNQVQGRRRLRAKADQNEALSIARALLHRDARVGYVLNERLATYWELIRLHTQLSPSEDSLADPAPLQTEIEQLLADAPQVQGLKLVTGFERTSDITYDPKHAELYGTTPSEYKLWVDYLFDPFGATLERRFRRYLVAISFGVLFWLVGLILSLLIGFGYDYLTTPGLWLFAFGVAWVTECLRWLSQVYHPATNAVRPCFPLDDTTYKSIVSPFAQNAVKNKRIFIGGSLFSIPILIYFGALMSGYKSLFFVSLAFPPLFPGSWLTGDFLFVKWVIIALYFWFMCIAFFSGAQLTLATAPLYSKLASLPIVPLPGLVTELFQSVLHVYLMGALMWTVGVVLVELFYQIRTDIIGIGLCTLFILLGLFAYLAPLEAVRNLWRNAKRQAVSDIVRDFYSSNTPLSADELKRLNEYIQSLSDSEPSRFNYTQLVNVVLPLVPLVANTFLSGISLYQAFFGR